MEKRQEQIAIREELKAISIEFPFPQPVTNHSVPDGYFVNLSERILEKIKKSDPSCGDLEGISFLSSNVPRTSPQQTPTDYFEGLADQILAQIDSLHSLPKEEEEISSLLSGMSRTSPHYVPENYFDTFPKLLGIRLGEYKSLEAGLEIQGLSPLLASLDKNHQMEVPENYFEGFARQISASLQKENPAPVVHLHPKPWRRRWLAAAMTIGWIALTVGGFYYYQEQKSFQHQLAQVSNQEIENYLQYHVDVFDRDLIYNNVNPTHLQSIQTKPSKQEIQQYLKENTNWDDESTN
ncbi:MAG: hypothetical protein ACYCOO_04205 [Chitinophagaceae bacterium]